jgi:hypothetical protein
MEDLVQEVEDAIQVEEGERDGIFRRRARGGHHSKFRHSEIPF